MFREDVTAYEILGVSPDADQKLIHAALRQLALKHHPDRVPFYRRADATLRFQAIVDAYEKVRTPAARAAYDQLLRETGRQAGRKVIRPSNDNGGASFGQKAQRFFRALQTVFWPFRLDK